jgi:hypothetical protein
MDIFQKLKRPFPVDKVHWRIGATNRDKTSAIALAYIDARDAMQRLDEVVGAENWQCRYPLADNGLLICEVGIRFGDEWVWKANGAGDTQVEAEKGKASDAFKRAAVLWGIGRYLYGLPNIWVPIDTRGSYAKLPDSSIAELIERLPWWAKPDEYDKAIAKGDSK